MYVSYIQSRKSKYIFIDSQKQTHVLLHPVHVWPLIYAYRLIGVLRCCKGNTHTFYFRSPEEWFHRKTKLFTPASCWVMFNAGTPLTIKWKEGVGKFSSQKNSIIGKGFIRPTNTRSLGNIFAIVNEHSLSMENNKLVEFLLKGIYENSEQ
jgi:hypothetical protein